jgi:hypothetical protein
MGKYNARLRRAAHKIKTDDLNDEDTEYIEFDALIAMFMEEFKTSKRASQKKIEKLFGLIMSQEGLTSPVTPEIMDKMVRDLRPIKQANDVLVKFPGKISGVRALLYAFMCGENT